MTVELTPSGKRGFKMPNVPGPIIKLISLGITLSFRLRGVKILTLTTVGAKTGRTHTVDLRWFADAERGWLIVASLGGAAKHPAWYYNLARNPDKVWVKVDGRTIKVRPESLKGAERVAAYANIASIAPGYRKYQESTDREIPVIRLTAESD